MTKLEDRFMELNILSFSIVAVRRVILKTERMQRSKADLGIAMVAEDW